MRGSSTKSEVPHEGTRRGTKKRREGARVLPAAEKRFVKENRSTSLIQRFIRPEEIGDAVAFVCGARASAINGVALRVDGGIVRTIV